MRGDGADDRHPLFRRIGAELLAFNCQDRMCPPEEGVAIIRTIAEHRWPMTINEAFTLRDQFNFLRGRASKLWRHLRGLRLHRSSAAQPPSDPSSQETRWLILSIVESQQLLARPLRNV